MRALPHVSTLSDDEYAAARLMYRVTNTAYAQELPSLASNVDLGTILEARMLGDPVMGACLGLITVLGLLLSRPPTSSASGSLGRDYESGARLSGVPYREIP